MTQKRLMEDWSYDKDSGIFTRCVDWKIKNFGKHPNKTHHSGYIVIQLDGKKYQAHRLAWLYVYGHFPDGQIDHINGIRTDNRLCNLRIVTNQDNQKNSSKRRDNKSGNVGISWCNTYKKWRATIGVDGKQISIGYFNNKEDAIKERAKKEKEHEFHKNHGK